MIFENKLVDYFWKMDYEITLMISPQNTCSVWNISDGAKLLIFYESQIPLTTGSFATQTFYIRCNYLGGLE